MLQIAQQVVSALWRHHVYSLSLTSRYSGSVWF